MSTCTPRTERVRSAIGRNSSELSLLASVARTPPLAQRSGHRAYRLTGLPRLRSPARARRDTRGVMEAGPIPAGVAVLRFAKEFMHARVRPSG
jgi:hypothetical protein